MGECGTPRPGQHSETAFAQPGASPAAPRRLWARVMLIGGGLMAAWGALVSVGIVFVLVARESGPGGPGQLVLGGFVIGIAPVLVGGFVCRVGLKSLRAIEAEARGAGRTVASR